MIAHYDKRLGRNQSLSTHSRNVAMLCQKYLSALGLACLGYIVGLLHDMGKATLSYLNYILSGDISQKGSIHHAPVGAIYVYERWFVYADKSHKNIVSQIIWMAIYGHHSGLMDVVDPDHRQVMEERLRQNKEELSYTEAVSNYLREVASAEELDALFEKAAMEYAVFQTKIIGLTKNTEAKRFYVALLMRLVLSALVDADRLDTACFEYNMDLPGEKAVTDWKVALEALEKKLEGFSCDTPVNAIRKEISEECREAAAVQGAIFKLTVPTGGGKTLSSLRFALHHAVFANNIQRIFYVIPFNTILDQNAHEIRGILDGKLDILEHHSNVVFATDDIAGSEEYELLSERWDTDIVLTSMVHFLNAIYGKGNTNARRMRALCGSVLIFDEVQSVPFVCRVLFERVIEFLANFCGCTVLLCTATQPQIRTFPEPLEIIRDRDSLYTAMRRVRFHDETNRLRAVDEATERLEELLQKHGSVLVIVNTKAMAQKLYDRMIDRVSAMHLSTYMYPMHRLSCIEHIRSRSSGQPFLCISTSLIEAGINVSFPCVVRSLAGLGSIMQAAGRCNRNGEAEFGDVYIWQLEENLERLPEIRAAADLTRGLLSNIEDLDALAVIDTYYSLERKRLAEKILEYANKRNIDARLMDQYPLPEIGRDVTICALLGKRKMFGDCAFPLDGAYKTAAEYFQVIQGTTYSVLIPEKKGADIAAELAGEGLSYERTKQLLREAGQYSVSLYTEMFQHLKAENAMYFLENVGVWVLRDGWYDVDTGIRLTQGDMAYLEY